MLAFGDMAWLKVAIGGVAVCTAIYFVIGICVGGEGEQSAKVAGKLIIPGLIFVVFVFLLEGCFPHGCL